MIITSGYKCSISIIPNPNINLRLCLHFAVAKVDAGDEIKTHYSITSWHICFVIMSDGHAMNLISLSSKPSDLRRCCVLQIKGNIRCTTRRGLNVAAACDHRDLCRRTRVVRPCIHLVITYRRDTLIVQTMCCVPRNVTIGIGH